MSVLVPLSSCDFYLSLNVSQLTRFQHSQLSNTFLCSLWHCQPTFPTAEVHVGEGERCQTWPKLEREALKTTHYLLSSCWLWGKCVIWQRKVLEKFLLDLEQLIFWCKTKPGGTSLCTAGCNAEDGNRHTGRIDVQLPGGKTRYAFWFTQVRMKTELKTV